MFRIRILHHHTIDDNFDDAILSHVPIRIPFPLAIMLSSTKNTNYLITKGYGNLHYFTLKKTPYVIGYQMTHTFSPLYPYFELMTKKKPFLGGGGRYAIVCFKSYKRRVLLFVSELFGFDDGDRNYTLIF